MSRAPNQLAPSWLPRQQRRHVDRQLRRLMRRDVCSVCGGKLKHNSCTASGLDARGDAVLACEGCAGRVATVFGIGLYSDRNVLTETDKVLDDIVRRGGGVPVAPRINLRDSPWKDDVTAWFKQNPGRSHRMRMPFPGESDKEVAKTPVGHALIVLVRQVKPGSWIRAAVRCSVLPLSDDEAAAHALFEVAARREAVPPDRQALRALIEKYSVHGSQSDA